MAELHGGSLTAYSKGLGQGSEFVLRIPAVVAAGAGREPAPQTAASTEPPRGIRALVVDDNVGAANMMGIALNSMGAAVKVVYDGEAAIEAASDFRPEIVFMDIGMVGTNGHDAARRIRANPDHRDILLIAVSGWGQQDRRGRSLEAGFDQHFVKPVDLSALRQVLATCKPR